MPSSLSALTSSLIGVVASLIVFSLLVQVAQELYKFLSKSKGRVYSRVLTDMLGPWAVQLTRPGALPELYVRGPFQFRRLRRGGSLLPLEKEALVTALERTAAPWVRRTLERLRHEIQTAIDVHARPSHSWKEFVDEIEEVFHQFEFKPTAEAGVQAIRPPGFETLREIRKFLEGRGALVGTKGPLTTGDQDEFRPREVEAAFRDRFLPHVEDAKRVFPQLSKNFEFSYRRKNVRHSVTIAFLIALLFNLPFDELWLAASRLSADEALASANRALAIYDPIERPASGEPSESGPTIDQMRSDLQRLVSELKPRVEAQRTLEESGFAFLDGRMISWSELFERCKSVRYWLGCLLTSILVAFGAPFWNDLAGALEVRRGKTPAPSEGKGGTDGES